MYTTIRYRCDPSILDHYEESYFGENAEREIFRRKKEQSYESWSESEELDKVIFHLKIFRIIGYSQNIIENCFAFHFHYEKIKCFTYELCWKSCILGLLLVPFVNLTVWYNSAIDLSLQAVAARQRSRYLRFARPPQEKQLIESRKKVMKEKKALTILLYVHSFDWIVFN